MTRDFAPETSGQFTISDVKELNLSAQSFFIQRAEINIEGNGVSQRVISTIKFAEPDSFLISVRVFGGIEAARIFITSDSILINDRLNRTLYFGSNQNVKKKYGFDLMFFPVLLGDLITGKQDFSGISCENGNAILREFKENYIVNYFIDCQTRKCKEITVENEYAKDYISIKFDNFGKEGKIIFPQHLEISNFANFALFEIDIKNVEIGTSSGIEFIPGRNYSRIEIK